MSNSPLAFLDPTYMTASHTEFIRCGAYLIWSRPQFLYMPIYESSYEKDSDAMDDNIIETGMAEEHRERGIQ